jgi:hypothetical protein
MNLLRSSVKTERGWWEISLLDLNIVADGPTETAMLRELEHQLVAEYHLAVKAGETPFVKLLSGDPETRAVWDESPEKQFRTLNLPKDVSLALSVIFRRPNLNGFHVKAA